MSDDMTYRETNIEDAVHAMEGRVADLEGRMADLDARVSLETEPTSTHGEAGTAHGVWNSGGCILAGCVIVLAAAAYSAYLLIEDRSAELGRRCHEICDTHGLRSAWTDDRCHCRTPSSAMSADAGIATFSLDTGERVGSIP